MVPKAIFDLFNTPGSAGIFATRNESLQPNIGRVWGARTNDDGTELTIFTPKLMISEHFGNFLHNGRIAVTVGLAQPGSHLGYQLKGKYLKHEDCKTEDHSFLDNNFNVFREFLTGSYGPEMARLIDQIPYKPAVAITLRVEEIFDQTPGPGAGKKIL